MQFKYPQFAVGVNISFSLRNRQAQADNIRSRLELKQSQDTLVRTKSQIEVRRAERFDCRDARQSASASRAGRRPHQWNRRPTPRKKRLTAGISTSYNVILIERDLFAARARGGSGAGRLCEGASGPGSGDGGHARYQPSQSRRGSQGNAEGAIAAANTFNPNRPLAATSEFTFDLPARSIRDSRRPRANSARTRDSGGIRPLSSSAARG